MENIQLQKYITPETPNTEYSFNNPEYLKYKIEKEKETLLNDIIKDQYQNFNNLGVNFLESNQLSDNNFANLIRFINDNYLLITRDNYNN